MMPVAFEELRRKLGKIGFGISLCPFHWQFGLVTTWSGNMAAFGPFRFAWRFV